ncbi:hypothetical protein G7046_g2137 [Stylonectria norvegica]|nr:hypothetical protein G7046_g2137 [Stylonectria norvegica]
MMFSAITVAAVVSALLATASPIHKRELGGILMCTGANATGTCQHKVYNMTTCHDLSAPYLQNIKTFAPDGEAFACYPRLTKCDGICMSPTGCTFGAVNFTYEHKYDLSAIKWDKLFKSFDCALNSVINAPPPSAY